MSDEKLRKRERLSRKIDIDRVFTEGIRRTSGNLRAVAVPNGLGYSRLGIGVGAKLCNAVKRNRLKRITREAFRLNKADIPTGLDLFVMHQNVEAAFEDIGRDLVSVAAKLREGLEES